MTPGRRAWIEKVAPVWAERAAALRRIEAAADAGAAARAGAIEGIVAGLLAELAAAPEDVADDRAAALAEAMESLRVCQPYFHAEWGVMVGNTHFLDHPREAAARKIEALGGTIPEGWIIYWVEPEKSAPPPPPEPIPFTAGPQMEMFA